MCGICGCGDPNRPEPSGHAHRHAHADGHAHEHEHEHVGADGKVYRHLHAHPGHDHAHEAEVVRADAASTRLVQVQQDILGKNDALAAQNRAVFRNRGTFVLNLMSSPGSGKTTLLVRTLRELKGLSLAVIEGDQQTSLDAERIRATGAPAVQVNTGKGCHLDAAMVGRALAQLPHDARVLFIENVGNLVCPAGFDLGESRRVVVVSVTEGEDKPLKYPDMFARADLVLVNKVDLLPHLAFDLDALERNLRRVRPGVPILKVAATTGVGLAAFYAWLREGAVTASEAKPA